MNKRLFLPFIILLLFSIDIYSQEPIQLNEVVIEKSTKNPKLKKIKFKNNRFGKYIFHDLYFDHTNSFYLIDSLPEGSIQALTFYFSEIKKNQTYDQDYKSFKVNKSEFEVSLYEVNEDHSIGKKINSEPISIIFNEIEKTRLQTETIEIDLSSFNFKAGQFFIGIKRITQASCNNCYYYAPEFYKTGDENSYIFIEDEKGSYKKAVNQNGYRLKIDIKTLTSYY